MPAASLLQCVHPAARFIVLTLLAVLIFLAIAVRRRPLPWIPFAVGGFLITLALWFGAYRISPLGFSAGRIPTLSGFRITRPQRPQAQIAPREVVLLAAGAPMGIEPEFLPVPVTCLWSASHGGAFEDPASCDTAYTPGKGAAFDVLRIIIRPACDMPSSVGEIRVSVPP